MNHVRKFLHSLFLLGLLAACGQSGPLYLPGNPSEVQAPPSQVSEPMPQSGEDDEREDRLDEDDLDEDDLDEDDLDDNGGT